MEYFAPGLRELQRIGARAAHRVRLALARRRLAAAETELGLLGWQQADFDEATERQVDAIQHVEREQGRLHNASAELAHKIQALSVERTRIREEYEMQRAQLEPEREKLRVTFAETEARLTALHKSTSECDRRAAEIDREQRKLEKRHLELLVLEPQTPQIRDEFVRIRDGLLAISGELADLQQQHLCLNADLEADEKRFAALAQQRDAFDRQLRELASAAEAADGKLADELREAEKEKARLASAVEKLESAKLDPYREIGRVLADSKVAPINQPQVLDRVLAMRVVVEQYATAIQASHASTAQEDRHELRNSFALLAIITLALVLFIGALL